MGGPYEIELETMAAAERMMPEVGVRSMNPEKMGEVHGGGAPAYPDIS